MKQEKKWHLCVQRRAQLSQCAMSEGIIFYVPIRRRFSHLPITKHAPSFHQWRIVHGRKATFPNVSFSGDTDLFWQETEKVFEQELTSSSHECFRLSVTLCQSNGSSQQSSPAQSGESERTRIRLSRRFSLFWRVCFQSDKKHRENFVVIPPLEA